MKKNKFLLMTGLFVFVVAVVVGGYWISLRFGASEARKHIVFQDKRVDLGETFSFYSDNSCVEDTVATLTAVTENAFTLRVNERNWKNDLNKSIEEITDYSIKDNDCLIAGSKCMDVGYKYCFSFSKVDSILNVSYELKEESTLPLPSDE